MAASSSTDAELTVHIVDIGDGFGCDDHGFENIEGKVYQQAIKLQPDLLSVPMIDGECPESMLTKLEDCHSEICHGNQRQRSVVASERVQKAVYESVYDQRSF